MAREFEVGAEYAPDDSGFDAILVERRTDKTIWVTNGFTRWMMRIRRDENGNEFVADSAVPLRYRWALTYRA